ncbi:Sin3 associated polypeptide p18-domain-containing protein [Syncephalis plumigaleata]|nr:Sin3 associated polypeptide p18-domain-containing protein [Syncephalis plumigaleata]
MPYDNSVYTTRHTEGGRPYPARHNSIDREKICPFRLRVFLKKDGFYTESDFTMTQLPVNDEVPLYAWKNTSLREDSDVRLEFKIVYLNRSREQYTTREFGTVHATYRGPDDMKTLNQGHFPGDFLAVSFAVESVAEQRTTTTTMAATTTSGPLRRSHDRFDNRRPNRNAPYPSRGGRNNMRGGGIGHGLHDRRSTHNSTRNPW